MTEIKDIATNGPTAEEMQKLHNQLLNDEVRSRQSSLSRAQQSPNSRFTTATRRSSIRN
jgi:hypothetical protein